MPQQIEDPIWGFFFAHKKANVILAAVLAPRQFRVILESFFRINRLNGCRILSIRKNLLKNGIDASQAHHDTNSKIAILNLFEI